MTVFMNLNQTQGTFRRKKRLQRQTLRKPNRSVIHVGAGHARRHLLGQSLRLRLDVRAKVDGVARVAARHHRQLA